MRGSCDLWAAGLSGGRWGSGHHHECDYEQQEEKRWEQSAASYGGLVCPIKGHVLRGHASRLTPALVPPPTTRKPPVETGTGGAEVCFWCACGVGLWITLRWGHEGVRRRGVAKLDIAGGTHLFSWGEKTTMTRWWCVIRGCGTPVATPMHVPKKYARSRTHALIFPQGESWWGLKVPKSSKRGPHHCGVSGGVGR